MQQFSPEHRFKKNKYEELYTKKAYNNKYPKTITKKQYYTNETLYEISNEFGRRPRTLQYILPLVSRTKSSPYLYPNPPIIQNEPVEFTTTKIKTTQKRQDDERCSQGGTCEFFLYCWMSGGLLDGSCGGLLKGCCHRVSKNGALGVQDSNSLENSVSSSPAASYVEGSVTNVINDNSKSRGVTVRIRSEI